MKVSVIFLFSILSTIAYAKGDCSQNEVLIGDHCWTLEDKKYLLDNSMPMNELCKDGGRIPTKEEYENVQSSRQWPKLSITSREHYLTSTKNSKDEYYFVNYYGTDNGFFAAARGSGTFVHYRCLRAFVPQTVEEEILNVLSEVATGVVEKADEEFKATYAKGGTGVGSTQNTNVLSEVRQINSNKNALINALGAETAILFDHLTVKAEEDSSGQYDQTIVKAHNLYEKLKVESVKTISAEAQSSKLLHAHKQNSIDIEKNASTRTNETKNATSKMAIPQIKEALASGEASSVLQSYRDILDSLHKGTLNANALLSGHNPSGAVAGVSSSSPSTVIMPELKILPELFTNRIDAINLKRKEKNLSAIDLSKKMNSDNGRVNAVATSPVIASALASSAVSGVSAASGVTTVAKIEASGTSTTSVPVEMSSLKVRRSGYMLEPIHKMLLADAKIDNAFEIIDHLKKLEDKISYSITDVTSVPPSTRTDRLSTEQTYLGVSMKSLNDHVNRLVREFGVLSRLQAKVNSLDDRLKELQKEYDPNARKWNVNSNAKKQRLQMLAKDEAQLKTAHEADLLMLSTHRLTIYNHSHSILGKLFRLADNICPAGMTLNQTWQSLGSGLSDRRRYICASADGKGHMLHFDKLPLMDAHTTPESGIVQLSINGIKDDQGKYFMDSNMSKGEMKCPESTTTSIFGKDLKVKFDSVIYEFTAERSVDPRFRAQGASPSWTKINYTTKKIRSNERKDTCIPHESGLSYQVEGSEGKMEYSPTFTICENKVASVIEQIQNDRIVLNWKIDKTHDVQCFYKYDYVP